MELSTGQREAWNQAINKGVCKAIQEVLRKGGIPSIEEEDWILFLESQYV